jgi:hypothetical protein
VRTVGLVGPSGTGKSHRAAEVAERVGARLIVDDGLLIGDGTILAGRSAKREASRMGAVRRAIFQDPAHAAEVRDALGRSAPGTVLILGTSRAMVDRIAVRLGLAPPAQVLRIDQVATEAQIQTALGVRRREGKHVIPAPTLEVRKGFSGYLVDPLRFLLRTAGRPHLVEKSIVRPTWSALGRFTIDDRAVGQLAARTAVSLFGVGRVLRVGVRSAEDGVRIDLDLAVAPGPLWPLLERVQRAVAARVAELSALNVLQVDVCARALTGGHRPPRRPVPSRTAAGPAASAATTGRPGGSS